MLSSSFGCDSSKGLVGGKVGNCKCAVSDWAFLGVDLIGSGGSLCHMGRHPPVPLPDSLSVLLVLRVGRPRQTFVTTRTFHSAVPCAQQQGQGDHAKLGFHGISHSIAVPVYAKAHCASYTCSAARSVPWSSRFRNSRPPSTQISKPRRRRPLPATWSPGPWPGPAAIFGARHLPWCWQAILFSSPIHDAPWRPLPQTCASD